MYDADGARTNRYCMNCLGMGCRYCTATATPVQDAPDGFCPHCEAGFAPVNGWHSTGVYGYGTGQCGKLRREEFNPLELINEDVPAPTLTEQFLHWWDMGGDQKIMWLVAGILLGMSLFAWTNDTVCRAVGV